MWPEEGISGKGSQPQEGGTPLEVPVVLGVLDNGLAVSSPEGHAPHEGSQGPAPAFRALEGS